MSPGTARTPFDLLTVSVGTGLRYGEVSALWCDDYDQFNRTIRVNKGVEARR